MQKANWFVVMFSAVTVFAIGCTSFQKVNAATPFIPCNQDRVRLEARAKELQSLVNADQDDRKGPFDAIDWSTVQPRDEARRKRVGEIFGEGCFSTSADYAAAALVYQHGDTPDHYFQTFLWAKKAIELGDVTHVQEIQDLKKLVAEGLDRYLVKSHQKQLFGTQFSRPSMNPKDCWCLEEVEKSFPQQRRSEYFDRNLNQLWDYLNKLNAENPNCKPAFCTTALEASPAGTIPGFW